MLKIELPTRRASDKRLVPLVAAAAINAAITWSGLIGEDERWPLPKNKLQMSSMSIH
jgi:hypothetical protein